MIKYGYIIASHHVSKENKKVGWMYREEPTDETDSGWRVFSGEETEEYAENPENFSIYDADTIISMDDSIKELLGSPVGTSYERTTGGVLVEVDD